MPATSPTKKPFAVFDIDGTLIRWQLYHAVVNELAKGELLGSKAYENLHAARMAWKVRTHPEAFKEYEGRVVALFDAAVTNIPVDVFEQTALKVVEEYKDQVYTYTRDLIRSLKERGYVLLAISGSQHELVKALADHYGFDEAIGSVYLQKDGRFTGQKQVASEDKGRLLDKLVKEHSLTYEDSYAVGDSASDIPMLERVERPIVFNPDRHLLESATAQGWTIIVERKNVIYRLESKNGQYILA